jgi:signal transduction histidine kinase
MGWILLTRCSKSDIVNPSARKKTSRTVDLPQTDFAAIVVGRSERAETLVITAQKITANEGIDPYATIVSNAPFGIYIVDSAFCLTQASEGCRKVFAGIDPLLGRDFAEILRILWEEPFASECVEHFRHTLRTGETYRAADTSKPRHNVDDEESYDWKTERITLPDGTFGVVCYFYDLTERIHFAEALRQSEEQLREARDQLELKVAERTSELEEAHRELTRSLREVVSVQESERQRISRDVHDHLGGTLTGLRLNLQSLHDDAGGDEHVQSRIDSIQRIATQLDSDVSYLAWVLRPAILDDLGLVPALEHFAKEWSVRFSVAAAFQATGINDEHFDRDIETNLYRITQEALTNVAKHADATSVSIILNNTPDRLTLIIEDNGKGFADDQARCDEPGAAKHGLGIGGMKDRARIIGASLKVESSSEGSAIFVKVPKPSSSI